MTRYTVSPTPFSPPDFISAIAFAQRGHFSIGNRSTRLDNDHSLWDGLTTGAWKKDGVHYSKFGSHPGTK